MKKTNTIYWIFTLLVAIPTLMSGVTCILHVPSAVEMTTTHFGYPEYFILFMGIAKLLAVIALLVPGFPRIKEWAYAGLSFDLLAALYSTIAVHDPVSKWVGIIIFALILATAYIYYHKKLKATA